MKKIQHDDTQELTLASKEMIQIARNLRQRQTNAETILWEALRDRRCAGLKFRRQHPIPNTAFVVDFFCHFCRLVIEVDGGIHNFQQEEGRQREAVIQEQGYHILRFTNEQIERDLSGVLTTIVSFASA